MTHVIDLQHEVLPAFATISEAQVGDHQLELGRLIGTGRPIVIDWRTEQAWIGTWEELAQVANDALAQEETAHVD